MSIKQKTESKLLGILGIAAPEMGRIRKRDDALIDTLAESIKDQGLINPITVCENYQTKTGYLLISGFHRLHACKKLGHKNIPARVVYGKDVDHMRLMEIDENLRRGELSSVERDIHIMERERIFNVLNGLKKGKGGPRPGAGRKPAETKSKSPDETLKKVAFETFTVPPEERLNFARDAAAKTGQGYSSIKRSLGRINKIAEVSDPQRIVGTSLDSGKELDALAKLSPEMQQRLIEKATQGEKVLASVEFKKQARSEKEVTLANKQLALPNKKYGVVYCDPPWKFKTYSENGMDRSADNHYATTHLDDLKKINVASIAADDCVCFMCATRPMLLEAIALLESWGFKYKTCAVWGKTTPGTGYWFRDDAELLLIGVKGDIPCPAPGTQWNALISAPKGSHSKKPSEFYELICDYFPNLPKVELFARNSYPDFDAWGAEAPIAEAAQ